MKSTRRRALISLSVVGFLLISLLVDVQILTTLQPNGVWIGDYAISGPSSYLFEPYTVDRLYTLGPFHLSKKR